MFAEMNNLFANVANVSATHAVFFQLKTTIFGLVPPLDQAILKRKSPFVNPLFGPLYVMFGKAMLGGFCSKYIAIKSVPRFDCRSTPTSIQNSFVTASCVTVTYPWLISLLLLLL